MASISQFNTKSPTIRRILKEAAELTNVPSADYTAHPLDTNLFEWHFTLRGPPAPSPFANGIYHGRIILPPTYPLRPPSFRFLTPSGRFEPNREICLSISAHHEESWQPAWGIRTALVAIRSFMDTDAMGQLGGVQAGRELREKLALESRSWVCAGCGGKSCEQVMKEREAQLQSLNGDAEAAQEEDKVPDELRLAYRDELEEQRKSRGDKPAPTTTTTPTKNPHPPTRPHADADADAGAGADQRDPSTPSSSSALSTPKQISTTQNRTPHTPSPTPPPISLRRPTSPVQRTPLVAAQIQQSTPTPTQPPTQTQTRPRTNGNPVAAWIDVAIGGLAAALLVMVMRKLLM